MSRPLRVLFVSAQAARGERERALLATLESLDRTAVEPVVCFLEDGPLAASCLGSAGIESHVVPVLSADGVHRMGRAARVLGQIAAGGGIGLIHSWSARAHWVGGRAARRIRLPCVWSQWEPARWRSRLHLGAALVPARMVLAPTAAAVEAQRRLNWLRQASEVWAPGVRLPTETAEARRARSRDTLGIGDDVFLVGTVGAPEAVDAHDVFLSAGASLCHARPNARLTVVAEGRADANRTERASLAALASRSGIGNRMDHIDSPEVLQDLLAAFDVLVDGDVSPRCISFLALEAMASGPTVVAADGEGTRAAVTHGQTGLLVPSGDHESLAAALLALCDDPARRTHLSAGGAAAVRACFDASEQARRLETLYSRITV